MYDPYGTSTLYQLGVIAAALVGGAGIPVSVLAWRRFRGTPFGRALAPLPWFTLLLTVYHPILLVWPQFLAWAELLEALAFVLLAAFSVQMVRVHRRLSRRPARAASA